MNKLLLIISCVVAVMADMLFVWWAKKDTHPSWSWILGIVLLNIATLVWMYTMRKGIESATAITFYALFTVAGCSFLGFMVFKEQLHTINAIGGYGEKILQLGLDKAKEIGLEKVLLYCDDENLGSYKIIENNGGILENKLEKDGKILRKYWIVLK